MRCGLAALWSHRARFVISVVAGGLSAVLCAATLVWRDWIERAFGSVPDHGSGAGEWLVSVVLAVVAVVAGFAGRRELRAIRRAAGY